MSYEFTEEARDALAGILSYIARDNKKASMRVSDRVFETCDSLANMPNMGRHPKFSTDSGLLYFPTKQYGDYLIFYRKRRKGIVIIDIIHGARDLPDLFSNK